MLIPACVASEHGYRYYPLDLGFPKSLKFRHSVQVKGVESCDGVYCY